MPGKFAKKLGKFAVETQAKIERTRRAIILGLFQAVIMDTPVLTGRLRGNWQCTLGSPALDVIDTRGASTPAHGIPPEQQQEILAVCAAIRGDEAAFLRNNLPYARRVEYEGWSKVKAPLGMMRINVIRFIDLVNEKLAQERIGGSS